MKDLTILRVSRLHSLRRLSSRMNSSTYSVAGLTLGLRSFFSASASFFSITSSEAPSLMAASFAWFFAMALASSARSCSIVNLSVVRSSRLLKWDSMSERRDLMMSLSTPSLFATPFLNCFLLASHIDIGTL